MLKLPKIDALIATIRSYIKQDQQLIADYKARIAKLESALAAAAREMHETDAKDQRIAELENKVWALEMVHDIFRARFNEYGRPIHWYATPDGIVEYKDGRWHFTPAGERNVSDTV